MLFKRKPREGGKYRSGGSNFWHCRIVVNGKLHQFSTKTTDKNKARHIEAEFRTKRLAELPDPLRSPTLSEFAMRFVNEGIVGRVSRGTAHYYYYNLMVLERSPLADMPIARIDRAAIDGFIAWRRKGRRVSVVTVNHNLRVLRRALHLAAEWNLITRPPKIRLLRGENQREFVLSDDDVKKFETAKFPKRYALMSKLVPFLVDVGLRRGEVCDLKWAQVDGKELQVLRGKTKFSRRRVPLTDRAKKILAELPRDSDFVFTVKGRQMTRDWISHGFLATRKKLGLPAQAVLHSCRHTFCSRLGARGASAYDIQRLAGHSDIKISSRYVHASAERLDAVVALLN